MIAIFGTHRELDWMALKPKNSFKIIHSEKDVIGHRFTHILITSFPIQARKAYEFLRDRQPELF